MKRVFIFFLTAIATMITVNAQDIKLPAPSTNGGLSINEALNRRRSIKEYDTGRDLTMQQIANLLWAGAGINRPDEGLRTNPTALNSQEIDLYLFTKKAVYRYDCATHKLELKAQGDHRALVAGDSNFTQDFVLDAPVSVVIVADTNKLPIAPAMQYSTAACDAGYVSENICLFCAGNGLATRPRMSMDHDGIAALLGLKEGVVPMLNNPVGYER